MAAELNLLPCPFCGGAVELERTTGAYEKMHGQREWWGVKCRNTINVGGTCAIQQMPSASQEAAVERWNRRAAPSASIVPSDGAPCASDELPEPEFKAYEYSADSKVWSEDEVRAILAADRRAREHELAEASRAGRMYQRKVDQKIIDRRAQQGEPVVSIDTQEFHDLLFDLACSVDHDNAYNDECAKALVAHIDAHVRTQLAPQRKGEPVAWMNPNEGCAMDAFLWQKDASNPQYSVPVYRAAIKAAAPADAPWHDAVLAECMRIETGYQAADPVATIKAVIDWHVQEASGVAEGVKIMADNYVRLTCGRAPAEDAREQQPDERAKLQDVIEFALELGEKGGAYSAYGFLQAWNWEGDSYLRANWPEFAEFEGDRRAAGSEKAQADTCIPTGGEKGQAGWIPTSERMPSAGQWCIINIRTNYVNAPPCDSVDTAQYDGCNWCADSQHLNEPSHWMPFPAAPSHPSEAQAGEDA